MRSIIVKESIHKPVYKQFKRVAAYCRVSTGLEEQKSSLRTQTNAYQAMISSHSDWIFAGIYSDEGISGTQTIHREGFLRMLEDCKKGKIDFIITKSISRFARNSINKYYALPYAFIPKNSVINEFSSLIGKKVCVETMVRGMVYFDLKTPDDIYQMSGFVKMMEENTGEKIADLQEIVKRRMIKE